MRLPVAILFLLVPALACGRRPFPPTTNEAGPNAASGHEVSSRPMDASRMPPLEGWRVLAAMRLSKAGPHQGLLQRTHANPTAAAAIDRGSTLPFPDDSKLVKESFTPKGERVAMTAMSKEAGEWVWFTADGKGRITGRFKGAASGSCEACHYTQAWRFDGSFSPVTAGKASLDPSGAPGASAKQSP